MTAQGSVRCNIGLQLALPAMAAWVSGVVDYAALSDETLAANFLAGDLDAFEALVVRYSRPLYNFAFRFVGNADDAKDVAQATFLQLYTHLASARLDQTLRPWLFQIARNKAIDLLRARRQLLFSDLEHAGEEDAPLDLVPDEAPLPEAIVERADLQRLLSDAITRLPQKYREVVALRYTTDLTFKEMGEALGMPENTVKTLFQRAKVRLRRLLGDVARGE
ncbi:MAG: sigma-70 family RNA polymerase sigma factor [Chloroflexota bacterium]|nr:sigma-70 family RNA polymerase sigma factor [Dehalococcoidia bacterium]MDW8252979.1 sigma-70 family RNA polymerase sigma factor [Chloroflexota bacterium]